MTSPSPWGRSGVTRWLSPPQGWPSVFLGDSEAPCVPPSPRHGAQEQSDPESGRRPWRQRRGSAHHKHLPLHSHEGEMSWSKWEGASPCWEPSHEHLLPPRFSFTISYPNIPTAQIKHPLALMTVGATLRK